MKAYFCLLFLVASAAASPTLSGDNKYLGAQVLRVIPQTQSQIAYLRGLVNTHKYDFWTLPRKEGKPVDIMALRWTVPVLKEVLTKVGMEFEVVIPEVYTSIIQGRMENEKALQKARQEGKAMEWTAYHEYDEIMAWVDELAATYPSLVTVEDVGTSYEGRTMKIVKVSTGGSGKPAIFADGGIHAREWISPATITYIMNEILTRNEEFADTLDAIDLYFMPDINPDGYSYSWDSDRMWRKTRSENEGSNCMGVDANRNWDFHWMESGASESPCSETYAGKEPFSEPETQTVRDQMLQYADAAQVYISFHSYGQYWLYPWGYDATYPPDVDDLAALANDAAAALEAVHGTDYFVGGSGADLYPAAGASDDYAKGVAGIKYAYTVELRDKGLYGFQLPPSQIIPTGEETFAGFEVVMNFVRDTYGKKR